MKRFIAALQIAALILAASLGVSCGDSSPAGTSSSEAQASSLSSKQPEASSQRASSKALESSSSAMASSEVLVSAAQSTQASSANVVAKTKQTDSGIDVMTIGSSSTYRYFIPAAIYKKYGITSQVVAGASTSGKMIKYYIEEAKKLYNPDVFVVELRWFIKKQVPPVRSKRNLDNAYRDVSKLKTASIRTKAANEMLKIGLTDNIPSNDQLRAKNPKWYDTSEYTGLFDKEDKLKGAKPSASHKRLEPVDQSKITESTPFSAPSEADLRILLNYCKENKIKVLFTMSPYQLNESEMKLNNTAASIVKSYGFKLLDANKILGKMGIKFETDFYNKWHTNVNGSVKYSEYLGKYLKANYKIKTRLSSAKKAEWNEAVSYWNDKYDEVYAKLYKKLAAAKVLSYL